MSKRMIGAGVTGLAVMFAVAPLAGADPVATSSDVPDSAAPDSSTPDTPAAPSSDAAAAPGGVSGRKAVPADTVTATDGPVTPDFGVQKIRVGVQVKSGAWVPPGTSTANTHIKIIETGPSVDGELKTFCQTEAGTATADDDPTATFCTFGSDETTRLGISPHVVVSPGPDGLDSDAYYIAGPGDKVKVFQTTVKPGLVRDKEIGKVLPCVGIRPEPAPFSFCPEPTDVVFQDPGLPPAAVDDTASVVSGHSVDIDVLANDEGQGAPEAIDSATDPAHGSAQIQAGKVQYTPDDGFTGTDTFDYTMSTPNGTATATVTVTVTAPPTVTETATATTTVTTSAPPAPAGNDNNGLSDTGVPSSQLEDIAAGLLLAGGAVTIIGRRRRPRGRHV